MTESNVTAERLDAVTMERRLHLWFFRDLSDEQRLGLFKLCGYPVDEMRNSSTQQLSLRHLVKALALRTPSDGEVKRDNPALRAALRMQAENLAAAKVRAIREGDGEVNLAAKLKDYDNAVRWHSCRPHDVNREADQHKAAAKLAEAVRAALASTPAATGEKG